MIEKNLSQYTVPLVFFNCCRVGPKPLPGTAELNTIGRKLAQFQNEKEEDGGFKSPSESDFRTAKVEARENKVPTISTFKNQPLKKGPKTILYYTPFFGINDYGFGEGDQPFKTSCQVKNCIATTEKDYLNNMGDFDAVIIHPLNLLSSNRYYTMY